MKKWLLISLVLALILGSMTGCTSKETVKPAEPVAAPKVEEPSKAIEYPTKSVELMVPWSPGGATDVIFRLVSEYAQVELGKPIVILNVAGAGGSVGATQVKDAEPDGYTLLGGHDHLITSFMEGISDFTYDAFEPICLLTTTPNLVTVNSKSNWNTITELLEEAKLNSGKLTWAASIGSTSHYFALGIMQAGGLTNDDIRIVGTPGTNESITNLLGNHVDVCQTQISTGGSYVEAGDLKFIGVAHDTRLPQAPDVPTLIEQGINYVQGTNRGIFAPKGTPVEIIEIINEAYKKAMENPELIKKIEDLGNIMNYKNPADYLEFMKQSFTELEEVSKSLK